MQIRVLVNKFSKHEMDQILIYYNSHKNNNGKCIERLDRTEGGFMIKIDEIEKIDEIDEIDEINKIDEIDKIEKIENPNEKIENPNEKIKQLRMNKKKLVKHQHYPSFTDTELLLLFESMKEILGDNVVLE